MKPIDYPHFPVPGSLTDRLCAWFSANPDETLWARDIALKFDTVASSVHDELAEAISAGLIVVTSTRGPRIYGAGPKLPKDETPLGTMPQRAAPAAPAAQPAVPKRVRTSRTPADLPDPAAVRIEANVPMPRGKRVSAAAQFHPIFEAMKPGDSFVIKQSELKWFYGAAHEWGKPRGRSFSARMATATEARLWRVK